MAVETAEERAAREAAEAAEEERRREIEAEISQLEGEIAEAEKNIRELSALHASCNDYQAEFETVRATRKVRLERVNKIWGQVRLVDAYGQRLEELLSGPAYMRAYAGMESAKSEISREIERQNQIIDECSGRIAGLRMEL